MKRDSSSSPEDKKPKASNMLVRKETNDSFDEGEEQDKDESISEDLRAKREYNRKCAQKSRMKRKQTFVDLQERVNDTTAELNRARARHDRARSTVLQLLSVDSKRQRTSAEGDDELKTLISEALPVLASVVDILAQEKNPQGQSAQGLNPLSQAQSTLSASSTDNNTVSSSSLQDRNLPGGIHGFASSAAIPHPSAAANLGEGQYLQLLSNLRQEQQQQSSLSSLVDQSGRTLMSDQTRRQQQSGSGSSNDVLLENLWREQQSRMQNRSTSGTNQQQQQQDESSTSTRSQAAMIEHLLRYRKNNPE